MLLFALLLLFYCSFMINQLFYREFIFLCVNYCLHAAKLILIVSWQQNSILFFYSFTLGKSVTVGFLSKLIGILFCLCACAYILKMPPRSGSSLFQGVGRLDILEKATLCPPLTSGGGLSHLYSKATVSRLAPLEGWHTHTGKKCLFLPACNETQQTKKLNQLLKAHISTVCP